MKLTYPLEKDYPLSQGFGQTPWAAQYQPFGLLGHNGLDYACPEGTAVLAADDGRVERIGHSDSGYGRHMLLRHAWGCTLYAHLSQPMLLVGETVKAGQTIAISGNTGNSSGAHLHFEVRPDSEPIRNGYNGAVDPAIWLTGNQNNAQLPLPEAETPCNEESYQVQAEPWLNLRSQPTLQATRQAAVYSDTALQVIASQGCWRKVRLTGWVYAAYLVKTETERISHEPVG